MTEKKTESETRTQTEKTSVWFKGTAEQAFAAAKEQNQNMLLYWGAVWCPPCNEIKEQVFSKPRFAELTANMVTLMLDGDGEGAQELGETLGVMGYPTILVLSPKGEELLRIDHGLTMDEFETGLSAALQASGSISDAIAAVKEGKANNSHWQQLSVFNWDVDRARNTNIPESPEERWLLTKSIAEKCPVQLTVERSRLTFVAIDAAMSVDEKSPGLKDRVEWVRGKLPEIFKSDETIFATRSSLMYKGPGLLKFVKFDSAGTQKELEQTLLAAMETIRGNTKSSVDTVLWSWNPLLQIDLQDDKKVTPETRRKIVEAVQLADRRSTTPYNRHSVISGAAYLLRKVEAYDDARELLRKELAITDTPWYYQSSMASLERDAGNKAKARDWIARAKKSATGRATRLQWVVNDVSDLIASYSEGKNVSWQEVEQGLGEYYELATQLKDGFSGRNGYRAKIIAKALTPVLKENRDAGPKVAAFQSKCDGMSGAGKEKCLEHFKSLQNLEGI